MDYKYFTYKYYLAYRRRRRLQRRTRACIMPGCSNLTVRSHTIPEATALKVVAENSYVLQPRFIPQKSVYEMNRVHVQKASIFSGFCNTHEQIFQPFERSGDFNDESIHFQNFRVLCRDLSNLRIGLLLHQDELLAYKEELFKYNNDLFSRFLPKRFKLTNVRDEIIEKMGKNVARLKQQIAFLESNFFNPYLEDLQNSRTGRIATKLLSIPIHLPICLAGRSDFLFTCKPARRIVVYLSVLPHNGRTLFVFSTPVQDQNLMLSVLAQYQYELSMLSFLEQWIVYGTDYWYMHPKTWFSFSANKANRIFSDLKETNSFPIRVLPYSIFDDARKKMISDIDTHPQGANLSHMIKIEHKKLEGLCVDI